jgi:NADPH-dependent glutamate synthase beta subunit-like oxidoreductase/coenzyme F420-reducing hydrogenase delta subunit/ferredoxin
MDKQPKTILKDNKLYIEEKQDKYPPCQNACPLYQDVRGYIYLIAQDRLDDAARLIRESNPLPSICGSICAHPCEDYCRRGSVDQPLSIRRLKRYVMENAPNPYAPIKTQPKNGGKIAILGSGPAGLTAAHDLAMKGYQVTVFEQMDDFGGSVRWGVPSYRLPVETIKRDIQAIEDLDVWFINKTKLGRDITLESLESQGYNAIILSMGLTQSRNLPIPNGNHPNVLTALPFLKSAKEKEAMVSPGDKVVVIGSGDVAMDVARTAVRMNVEEVKLTCLEKWEQMPASSLEKKEALEEGINMDFTGLGPKSVVLDDKGDIKGLKCMECVSAYDEEGRFHPQFNEQNVSFIPANKVIFAIGQYSSLDYLRLMDIKLDKRGRLKVDKKTGMTSRKGVFSCGEVSTGPGLMVEAMAHARRIANEVDAYLNHKRAKKIENPEVIEPLENKTIQNIKNHIRQQPSVESVESRIDHFDEIEQTLTHDEAIQETKRCLNCGRGAHWNADQCAFCLNCVRVCPYEVPKLSSSQEILIDQDQCQACGLCYSLCPASTIDFRMDDVQSFQDRIRQESERLKNKEGSKQLVLYCYYSQHEFFEFQKALETKTDFTSSIGIPCVGKLKSQDVFLALSQGYDQIRVIGCDEVQCTHPESSVRAHAKVDEIHQEILDMGYNENKIRFSFVTDVKKELNLA